MLRPNTPDHTETGADGRTTTVITLKRYCRSGHLVGDATEEEVMATVGGRPRPPAQLDCEQCRDALTEETTR